MKDFYFFDTARTFAVSLLKEQIENTYFGFIWFLINPLVLFTIIYFVFFDKFNFDGYFLYLGIGILLWSFMAQSLNESVVVNRNNALVIKSVNFPYSVFIAGIVLKNLVVNLASFFIFSIFTIYFLQFNSYLLFYPFVLLLFSFFVFGLSLILSTVATYNGDAISLWGLFAPFWWFFTPVFYPLAEGGWHYNLNLLNPAFYFITFARIIVLNKNFSFDFFVLSFLAAGIFLSIGFILFEKLKNRFAEVL